MMPADPHLPHLAKFLVGTLLLLAIPATAQTAHDGPEWGGKDHEPTRRGVIRREDQAGIRLPPARLRQNKRTVRQLDRELLHDEGVGPHHSLGQSTSR